MELDPSAAAEEVNDTALEAAEVAEPARTGAGEGHVVENIEEAEPHQEAEVTLIVADDAVGPVEEPLGATAAEDGDSAAQGDVASKGGSVAHKEDVLQVDGVLQEGSAPLEDTAPQEESTPQEGSATLGDTAPQEESAPLGDIVPQEEGAQPGVSAQQGDITAPQGSAPQAENAKHHCRLFVGCVPHNYSELDLKPYFEQVGLAYHTPLSTILTTDALWNYLT